MFEAGRNCWRVARAERMSYLIDGAAYFPAFRHAAMQARRSIYILGWDIHSEFELVREDVNDGFPTRLGPFLDALARRCEDLDIYVLTWDYSMVVAADREWTSRYRLGWKTHECVHFAFDDRTPGGGSHHQKVVVIDDRIAFVGGLDFTRGRWDTSEHRRGDPIRSDFEGDDPKPYHDVQAMVSGEIAATLGDLARKRWAWATGEQSPEPESGDSDSSREDGSLWPEHVAAELEDTPVAVALTLPELEEREAVRHTGELLVDAIACARRYIYLENQYFTAPRISEAVAERLQEEDGPEVILVLPRETIGWMSQYTMDVLRERRLDELRAADRHGRLRVYYPDRPDLEDQCINVHSKVLVVDEDLVFVGSANFNNRSLGLDSECSLAVESGGIDARRPGIARLRDRLLAEHLDVASEQVAEAIGEHGSLIDAIESLQGRDRSLRSLEPRVSEAVDASVPETSIADPEQPIDTEYLTNQLLPEEDKPSARKGLAGLVALVLMAVLLAAAWRWTPLSEWVDPDAVLKRISDLRGTWVAPFAVVAIYIVGGFLMFPVTVLIVATGLAFGAAYGFSYALLGAELSALAAYAAGHYLGHDAMRRLSDRWVSRASRFLGRQGLLAVVTLRIVPVAPFTVVNLVAGASHIRFRDFALGTLLGMIPGTLALTVLSDRVLAAVRSPDLATLAVLGAVLALIALGTWLLRRWAGDRQAGQN